MPDYALLKEKISDSNTAVIVTHRKPDGDAMGSSLGLWHFLKELGLDAQVITPTDYADNLHWLPGNDSVIEFPKAVDASKKLIAETDLLFCLDFNALSRIEEMEEIARESKAYKVLVDHHQQPEDFANWAYSDTAASSTCELVYDIIAELGGDISDEIAVGLYTGILTDTGSFQFSATTGKVHRISGDLIDIGVKPEVVYELIYNSFRKNVLQFFGYCLDRRMRLISSDEVAYMALSMNDMQRFHIGTGGTEGLVNFPMKINSVKLSALFKEDKDRIKISFRSKGDIDVNKLAREYFNGGGHINAAGGAWFGTLEEAVARFIDIFEPGKKH
jgi:phosphoesterase RecJ-like protein